MATTYFGTSTDNFTRLINSTTAHFFKKEEKNILLRRRLPAAIQAKGRVKHNIHGDELKWPVRYKRSTPVTIGDVVSLNFPRQNKDKVAVLPWAGLAVTDSVGEKEKMLNQGPEAILKLTSSVMERLRDDFEDQFGLELWKNGNNNTGGIHGLHTLAATSTRAKNTSDQIYKPTGSYAGHSMVPGTLGTWGSDWPNGTGDAQYEWWSPILMGVKSTTWAGNTWADNCIEVLRWGIFAIERTTKSLDMICLTRSAYLQFVEKLASKENINIDRGGNQGLLTKMGFGSVTNYEGVDVTWEEGVDSVDSSTIGYGVSLDTIELDSPQSQLFRPAPIDFNMDNLTDRFLVRFWGQLRLNPRTFLYLYDDDNVT